MRSRHRRTAEELEALLEGRLSSDEAGGDARRLATLATSVAEERPGPVATLSEDRRLLLRDRLLDDIAAMDAEAPATAPARAPSGVGRRRPARAALASGLASTLLAATGVTVAAQEALPGDALYGLKKGTESVRMNLTSDATQAARLELRFAEERLAEITAGAAHLRTDELVDALAEMDARSATGAQQLILAAEESGDESLLVEVDDFLERQSSGLVDIFPRLPIEARPHAEDSLAVLREIRQDLLVPALEACDCVDIVPATHGESRFVRRTSSQPLPPAPADEGEAESPAPAESPAAPEEDAQEPGDEPLRDLTSGETTTSGDDGSELLEPLGETGQELDTGVEDTVEDIGDTLQEGTKSVGDLLEDTGETLDEAVDEAEDEAEDLGDATSDGLGD